LTFFILLLASSPCVIFHLILGPSGSQVLKDAKQDTQIKISATEKKYLRK